MISVTVSYWSYYTTNEWLLALDSETWSRSCPPYFRGNGNGAMTGKLLTTINFKHEEDATAFKLKFGNWIY